MEQEGQEYYNQLKLRINYARRHNTLTDNQILEALKMYNAMIIADLDFSNFMKLREHILECINYAGHKLYGQDLIKAVIIIDKEIVQSVNLLELYDKMEEMSF